MSAEQNGSDGIPAPPWQRVPQRTSRRRRDRLTQDVIVEVGLRLLDADGLDRFSMRRVAEELDTGAASLYWHVGSKDGLLDLIFDTVIGEIDIPEPDPGRWQELLKTVARNMRATILNHRDIVRVSVNRIPLGPNSLRFNERVLAILRSGGVPDDIAVSGLLLMFSVVNGFTIDETGLGGDASEGAPPPVEAASVVRDYFASLPATRFPHLTAVADTYAKFDRDALFEMLIALYVDGLAQRVDAATQRGTGRAN
ncbi:TetR/AcrR family transcriptional regulator C-terminal domain-containing protein, partial [Haloactinopolyspora sp.]|uniref:TetR/AcrR family transcriptional regulator C-terminal domain-containing protein n=1 Tax=Haloactinopolyspora sp. TaxID=1966353 RepID=UPI002638F842